MNTYTPEKGMNIYQAAEQAVKVAWDRGRHVDFTFNGIPLLASPRSHPHDLATIYDLKCRLRRAKENYA